MNHLNYERGSPVNLYRITQQLLTVAYGIHYLPHIIIQDESGHDMLLLDFISRHLSVQKIYWHGGLQDIYIILYHLFKNPHFTQEYKQTESSIYLPNTKTVTSTLETIIKHITISDESPGKNDFRTFTITSMQIPHSAPYTPHYITHLEKDILSNVRTYTRPQTQTTTQLSVWGTTQSDIYFHNFTTKYDEYRSRVASILNTPTLLRSSQLRNAIITQTLSLVSDIFTRSGLISIHTTDIEGASGDTLISHIIPLKHIAHNQKSYEDQLQKLAIGDLKLSIERILGGIDLISDVEKDIKIFDTLNDEEKKSYLDRHGFLEPL